MSVKVVFILLLMQFLLIMKGFSYKNGTSS